MIPSWLLRFLALIFSCPSLEATAVKWYLSCFGFWTEEWAMYQLSYLRLKHQRCHKWSFGFAPNFRPWSFALLPCRPLRLSTQTHWSISSPNYSLASHQLREHPLAIQVWTFQRPGYSQKWCHLRSPSSSDHYRHRPVASFTQDSSKFEALRTCDSSLRWHQQLFRYNLSASSVTKSWVAFAVRHCFQTMAYSRVDLEVSLSMSVWRIS